MMVGRRLVSIVIVFVMIVVLTPLNTFSEEVCKGYPPQAPRDIDNPDGENRTIFSKAPNYTEMNLCNLHFHVNAEHKSYDFSVYAGDGVNGLGGGYQCNNSKNLTKRELSEPNENFCKDVKPGDTIEVHWVYTSCETKPGKSLLSCFSGSCINPNLRVESQVFTVVNDSSALNFLDYAYGGNIVNGYHQAKVLPSNTGKPVVYVGSTTGALSFVSARKNVPAGIIQISQRITPRNNFVRSVY